jgi:hypothetical protein
LKQFLAFAASNWKQKPEYVLLAGDTSYDPKDYLGYGDAQGVPTKLIATAYLETASDDWFADFDNDGVAELMVGRLPARTGKEATAMVAKLIEYERSAPAGDMLLVADANDGYDFEAASARLGALIPPTVNVTRVNRGQTDLPAARAQFFAALGRGQRVVNYIGHGSLDRWRGDLLAATDAEKLTNQPSLFVMMTCLNGYFQNAGGDSLAESLMKADGGAIAVWASSAMTQPEAQALMNQRLYQLLFAEPQPRLGKLLREAKAAIGDADVRRSWILLGDPTMRLK